MVLQFYQLEIEPFQQADFRWSFARLLENQTRKNDGFVAASCHLLAAVSQCPGEEPKDLTFFGRIMDCGISDIL